MQPSLRAGIRATGAFALSLAALLPVSFIALLIAMSVTYRAVSAVFGSVFVMSQLAFPDAIQSNVPYEVLQVPTLLTAATWIVIATTFGLIGMQRRIPRLWLVAPGAVVGCIVISTVLLYAFGFQVVLDGP